MTAIVAVGRKAPLLACLRACVRVSAAAIVQKWPIIYHGRQDMLYKGRLMRCVGKRAEDRRRDKPG
jgi:hypothetical protein